MGIVVERSSLLGRLGCTRLKFLSSIDFVGLKEDDEEADLRLLPPDDVEASILLVIDDDCDDEDARFLACSASTVLAEDANTLAVFSCSGTKEA